MNSNSNPTPSPAAGSDLDRELHKIIDRHDGLHGITHNVIGGKLLSEEHCANCRETARSILNLITAQNNATYEAVMNLLEDEDLNDPAETYGKDDQSLGDNPYPNPDLQYVVRRATRNVYRAKLRQSMAKIFGKENKEP